MITNERVRALIACDRVAPLGEPGPAVLPAGEGM